MVRYILNVFTSSKKQDIAIEFNSEEDLTLGRLQHLIVLLVSFSLPKWHDIQKNTFTFQVGSYEFQHVCDENTDDQIRNFVAFIQEPIPIKVKKCYDITVGIVKASHSRCCCIQ